ncbi:MAG TPA: carbohydrate kinase [Cytophagales bacterium]|jgi:fructokinase|nr:carbohydrate kinase [Cytophagales bacterium]
MRNFTIVGIGEILWDLFPGGKMLGGAPANFAYHAQKQGNKGYIISAVGNDQLGNEILKIINEKNLGNLINLDSEHPTGTVEVTLDSDGVPTYNIIEEVAWDNIPFSRSAEKIVEVADAICFGSLAQRNETSRNTIMRYLKNSRKNCLKVYDINLRQLYYDKSTIKESLNIANVLKLNEEELDVLIRLFDLDDVLESVIDQLLHDFGLSVIALTMGTEGSYIFSGSQKSFLPTPKIELADTVGAGDSFTATMVSGLLQNLPLETLHQNAVEVSAFVCSSSGAMPDYPEEITRRLS